MAEMNKRFRKLRGEVVRALIKDDVLALNPKKSSIFNASPGVQAFRFSTNPEKYKSFTNWFSNQVDAGVLEVDGTGKPWLEKYTTSAYNKGAVRAYTDVHKDTLSETPEWYRGSKESFLRSAFGGPEAAAKIQMLYTRAFDELKGVSATMSQQMGRILADGLSHGEGPYAIARKMNQSIGAINKKRALAIARTEIVRAHAEGQLDGFEALGVQEVGMMAEWSTAADDHVCFPKGTMITMPGKEAPIENIYPGDLVETRYGRRRVLKTTKRTYGGTLVQIVMPDRASLWCTWNHLIFVKERGWVPAHLIMLGEHVLLFQEDSVFVKDVIFHEKKKRVIVYNLEVEEDHEYYAEGVLVHNCDECAPLDGAVMTIAEARGMIPRHTHCVIGSSVIESDDVLSIMKTHYTGKIFEIVTAKGRRISITPNHILLTKYGFVPAHLLYDGLEIIDASDCHFSINTPNDNRNKPCIADVFKTFSKDSTMLSESVPLSTENFHGDGKFCNSEIDIIRPNCELWGKYESAGDVVKSEFPSFQFINCESPLSGSSPGTEFFCSIAFSFDNSVGSVRESLALFLGSLLHSCKHGGASVSDIYSGFFDPFVDCSSRTMKFFRQCLNTHPILKQFADITDRQIQDVFSGNTLRVLSEFEIDSSFLESSGNEILSNAKPFCNGFGGNSLAVEFDKIVGVNVHHVFDLPVYDVETTATVYQLNGIVSSNCRCAWIPANVGEKDKGQKYSKSALDRSVVESIKAEHPKAKSAQVARALSRWIGKEKKFAGRAKPKR
uniref:Hint domain-containing protein n=1 Tax=viral metagenome TaxID=1070528 RepID=A0A6M3IWR1_9ZZZZ